MDPNEAGTEEFAPVAAEGPPPGKQRRIPLPVLGGLVLLVIAGVAVIASRHLPGPSPAAVGTVRASGIVEARTVQVNCEVGGILAELLVSAGQAVAAGEVVAVVSSEASAAEVEQGREAVGLAQERLKQAEEALKQQETVVSADRQQQGSSARRGSAGDESAEIKAARAKVQQSATAVEGARTLVRQAEARLTEATGGGSGGGGGRAGDGGGESSAAINEAQAAVRAAETAAGRADKEYERAQTLSQQGAVSPGQLEQVSLAREQAGAELRAARERLARAQAAGQRETGSTGGRATLQAASGGPVGAAGSGGNAGRSKGSEQREGQSLAAELSAARATFARTVAAHEAAVAELARLEARSPGSAAAGSGHDEMSRQIMVEANRQILEIRRTEVQAAQAQWQQAQAVLVAAEANVDKYRITAPVSGIIGQIQGVVGDAMQAGAPLLMVVDSTEIWVKTELETAQKNTVRVGDIVEVQSPEQPDSLAEGMVKTVGSQPVEGRDATGLYEVEITLTNPPAWVRPGAPVTVVIHTGGQRHASPRQDDDSVPVGGAADQSGQ